MKKCLSYFTLTSLFFIISCNEGLPEDYEFSASHIMMSPDSIVLNTSQKKEITFDRNLNLDTILEKNDPNYLDFSKHQLFIDTTRNSKYYEEIANWKPNKSDSGGVDYYLKSIEDELDGQKFELKNFPRNWINVHQLNGEYVIYNPLNGIDVRFELTNSSLNCYAIESDADAINSVEELTDNSLLINLKTIPEKSESQMATLTIAKTTIPYIYLLKCKYDTYSPTYLVTPLTEIKYFDLVVSDAQELVSVPVQFEKINFDLIKLLDPSE